MKFLHFVNCGALVTLLLFVPFGLRAESVSPGRHILNEVDRVREIVLAKENKVTEDDLQKELQEVIVPLFDFQEMSQRCLGANWRKGSPAQQEEFVDLFTKLLSRTYLKKIRDNVKTSKISLVGEIARDGKALVKSSIDDDGEKISLDYRLFQKAGQWKIYDVVIENVGLVSNYRNEFAGIIRKGGFPDLLERLRDKESHKADE